MGSNSSSQNIFRLSWCRGTPLITMWQWQHLQPHQHRRLSIKERNCHSAAADRTLQIQHQRNQNSHYQRQRRSSPIFNQMKLISSKLTDFGHWWWSVLITTFSFCSIWYLIFLMFAYFQIYSIPTLPTIIRVAILLYFDYVVNK